jgi:hypothetical protein
MDPDKSIIAPPLGFSGPSLKGASSRFDILVHNSDNEFHTIICKLLLNFFGCCCCALESAVRGLTVLDSKAGEVKDK